MLPRVTTKGASTPPTAPGYGSEKLTQLANVEAELSAEEQSKKAALQAAVGAVDKKQLKEMLTRR